MPRRKRSIVKTNAKRSSNAANDDKISDNDEKRVKPTSKSPFSKRRSLRSLKPLNKRDVDSYENSGDKSTDSSEDSQHRNKTRYSKTRFSKQFRKQKPDDSDVDVVNLTSGDEEIVQSKRKSKPVLVTRSAKKDRVSQADKNERQTRKSFNTRRADKSDSNDSDISNTSEVNRSTRKVQDRPRSGAKRKLSISEVSDLDEDADELKEQKKKENKQAINDPNKSRQKGKANTNEAFISKRGRTVSKINYNSSNTNKGESSGSESSEIEPGESDDDNYDSGNKRHLSASVDCARRAACKKCGTAFNTDLQLSSHMRSVHSAKSQRCVICSEGFVFKNYQYFVRHMRSFHPEIERYPCKHQNCQRSFHTAKQLRDHEKSHYVYSCQFCKKIFSMKKWMHEHVEKVHQ